MEYWLFLRVLSRRKWLIVGLMSLTLIATYVAIEVFPTPVEARTSILFNFQTPRDIEVFDDRGYYPRGEQVEHFNFVALFKSNVVLEEAFERASQEVDLGPLKLENVRKQGKASLSLIQVGGIDEKTSIIEYVVTLRNPERAIALCRAVSEVAISKYKDILADAVVKSREYLRQQVVLARVELDEAQNALEHFYKENPEFTHYLDRSTYSGEAARSESNLIDLQVKLAALNAQIESVRRDIKRYAESPVDDMPVSVQSNILINELRGQLVKLRLERDRLLERFSPDYPSVLKATKDIEEVRSTLHKTYLTMLNEKLRDYTVERDKISASLSSINVIQDNTTDQYNAFSVKRLIFDGLERDLSVAESNYRLMGEKYTEAKIREDEVRNRYTLAIIDKPDTAMPKQEFFHKPAFKMIFAFFGSLLFSLLLVFLIDYFELRYRSTTDVSLVIDLPILGEIPEHRAGK